MSGSTTKATLQTAFNLLLFAIVGTAVLAFTFSATRERIVKSEELEKLNLITQIVPASAFDNDIVKDTVSVPASPLLGTDDVTTAYRARLKGKPSVVVLESIAPDGYSGKIGLVVAVRADGAISGVRVVWHKETPGLGDYIDYAKSHWIAQFDGASNARYKDDDWKVKKDGGQFDYMAGATITPRAVVKAVHKTLQYFDANRDTLFASDATPSVPEGTKK